MPTPYDAHMDKSKLKASYVQYCESLKSRGIAFINNDIDKAEYLNYNVYDLKDAILNEQNEHIRNVLLVLMFLKVEKQFPEHVKSLTLTHTKN